MLEGQDSFDHTADAGAPFRVANIGLHRANVHALVSEDVSHSPCLNGITYGRPSSVALVDW